MNVQISIRGRQFNVRTTDDGASIRRMAEELDNRLSEQAGRARSYDEHSVAVITALNLMSELHLYRQQLAEKIESIERDMEAVISSLESVLPVSKED